MILEEFIADLNANVFFREFSFSKNDYSPTNGTNIEFADHVIWIDEIMIIFQMKERDSEQDVSAYSEMKWFENKILHKATKQIRTTLQYFEEHDSIIITNQQGHRFDLKGKNITQIAKVILYSANDLLPTEYRQIQYYISSTAGFIHIFPGEDYLSICRTLITPADVVDYLSFRESLLQSQSTNVPKVSEKALVGQFLSDQTDALPSETFSFYVDRLDNSNDSFDLSGLFHSYKDSISYTVSSTNETDYYRVIAQFAKLKRYGLREAKKRINLCVDACQKDEFRIPYRIFFPETECGFVFVPLQSIHFDHRIDGLRNFSLAAKYDNKADKQIGVSFLKKGEYFFIDWCYIEFPWVTDTFLEQKLRDNNPFREVKERPIEKFRFKN